MAGHISFDWRNAKEYLEGLLPEDIRRLEAVSAELSTQKSIGPSVAQLVDVMILATRPKRVLEVGTSAGYAAIAMGRALQQVGGKLTTIEIDPRIAACAEDNIHQAGLDDVVEVVIDDANRVLAGIDEPFGLILQDGSKDDYLRMLPRLIELLEPNGLLVTDDVLFPVMDLPENVKPYQYALTLYNGALQEKPNLHTVWLPIGDGVSVSVKISARPS